MLFQSAEAICSEIQSLLSEQVPQPQFRCTRSPNLSVVLLGSGMHFKLRFRVRLRPRFPISPPVIQSDLQLAEFAVALRGRPKHRTEFSVRGAGLSAARATYCNSKAGRAVHISVAYFASISFLLSIAGINAASADLTFRVPPVTTTFQIADQPVAVTISGTIQGVSDADGDAALRLNLDAGLSDLQRQIAPILRAQLNQDNRCGERLSVDQASLIPSAPSSLLTANVHYEKWACAKAFGKEIVKKLIGGNGVIQMRLTPAIENREAVQLRAEILSIDADGQLGEVLRSGSFGTALQEKIRKTIVSAIEKSTRLTESLPPAIRGVAALRSVQFSDAGEGRLGLNLIGEARVTAQQAKDLTDQLKK